MEKGLLDRLRKQTVRIKGEGGSGFFIDRRHILTAAHCVYGEKDNQLQNVLLNVGGCGPDFLGKVSGIWENKLALIELSGDWMIEDVIPLGCCSDLQHEDEVDLFGYPRRSPGGYPARLRISQNRKEGGNVEGPSIHCLVRSREGGLDTYEGLSGSPVVFQGYIVGMVAQEDEGGYEANAIRLFDFSLLRELFAKEKIVLKEVFRQEQKCKKLNVMEIYCRAWWVRRTAGDDNMPTISDRHSIILANLLLTMRGSGNIILASRWESGLAEALEDETTLLEGEFKEWKGRHWTEYTRENLPNWESLEEGAGVIISISAEKYNGNIASAVLPGMSGRVRDVVVVFNIWSEQPEEAVSRAIAEADGIDSRENYDLLTVFDILENDLSDKEALSQVLLVHDAAQRWIKNKTPDFFVSREGEEISVRMELASLDNDKADALGWEISQRYAATKREEWKDAADSFRKMCSTSMKELMDVLCEKKDRPDMKVLNYGDLKRWFGSLKKEGYDSAIRSLRSDSVCYWIAVTSNRYGVRYIIQEMCEPEGDMIARLVLGQGAAVSNDIILGEEVGFICRQIRPKE